MSSACKRSIKPKRHETKISAFFSKEFGFNENFKHGKETAVSGGK